MSSRGEVLAAIAAAGALLLLAQACSRAPGRGEPPPNWRERIAEWRAEREDALRAESGWLTLVALAWLDERPRTVGTAESADIRLPAGSAPEFVGTFRTVDGRVEFVAAPGAGATIAGRPVERAVMHTDRDGEPDVVRAGRVSIHAIDRDGRLALRIKDPEAPARKNFAGLDWFPVDPRWRVPARWEPFDEPREVTIPTAIGTGTTMTAPGRVVFEIDGTRYPLVAFSEHGGQDGLFIIFRDATSGETTYGAGRYLRADPPEDGWTVLDFNQAYNPPCAFTKFATCPYPPPGNRLPIPIEAGEKAYRGSHAP